MPLYLEDLDKDFTLPAQESSLEPEDDRFEFTKGFSAGIDQTQALGGGLLALIGSATGSDDLFYSGLDIYNEQMAEAAESQADVGRIEDIDGFDDFLSYVSYTAGNAIPSLASAVASGGIGGVVAKAAVKKGIEAKAKDYVDSRVKDQAAAAFKKRVANDYASAALSRSTRIGAGVGAGAFSTGIGAGESFTRILEEQGEEAPGVALATGLVSGSLDALTPMRALKRILPSKQFESARDAIGSAASRKTSLHSRIFREAGKQAGVEGVTEAMQEVVQTIASEYVGNNYDDLAGAFDDALFDESKRSAYMNAFAAGLVGGTTFGSVSGLVTKDPDPTSRISKEELEDIDRRVDEEDERLDQLSDQVREEEALPEKIANFDGVASARARQEDVRARVRRQIDARQKAQEAVETVEAETREPDAPPQIDPPEEATVAPRGPISEPVAATPLGSLIGQNVRFGDYEGILARRDEGFFVVTPDEDIFIESGEAATAESLGITSVQADLAFENDVSYNAEDSTFILRGKKYTYLRANSDESGATISIQAVDEEGNSRTIRDAEVVARIERLKGESELPDRTIDMDDLTAPVQEEIVAEAEAAGEPIPDSVPVESAIDKAMKLEGYEREVALSKIDEAIVSAAMAARNTTVSPQVDSSEITTPEGSTTEDVLSTQYNYRNKLEPEFDRAFNIGTKTLRQAIAQGVAFHNNNREAVYAGTEDSFTRSEITVDELMKQTSRSIQADKIKTKPFTLLGEETSNNRSRNLVLAQLDLLSMGLPKEWLQSVDGGFSYFNNSTGSVSHQKQARRTGGFFAAMNNEIPLSIGYVAVNGKYLDKTKERSGELRFILAHEIAHAADHRFQISDRLPGFRADVKDTDDGSFKIEAGEIISELYTLYTSGSELGLEFAYPLSYASMLQYGKGNSQALVKFLQAETFAQATATFLNSPALLKKEAPITYKAIVGMLKDPTLTAFDPGANTDGNNLQGLTERDSRELREDVRAPAESGGDEGGGLLGNREASQPSAQEGQAGEGLGGTIPDDDGDIDGQSVRSQSDEREGDLTPQLDNIQLVADRSELAPASQQVTSSTILYGDEPTLDVGARPTVVSVAKEFDKRVAEAYPDRDLKEQNEENADIVSDLIAHEALQALNEEGNAGQWYQEKVANAMSLAAQRFPELDTDPNSKFAFTAIMAITSNGASVAENSANTFSIYEQYRESKTFPDFGVGKEAQAMKKSFMLLNDLIEADGIESVRDFMDQDVTVKELKDDFGLTVSGELMGTQLKGSAILGPKIGGGFYQNLNGNFDPLTMDRWFMRTYGRLTGSLMSEATRKLPAQIAKFREVALSDDYRKKLKQDGISRVQLRKDDDYLVEYATKVQSAYAQGGFKIKNTLNKASNTLKNSQGEKQAPQNGTEREYIRQVMQLALDKVNVFNSNDPINMGALQAIIWYPEKELYKLHGVGNAKSEPTDYETEFRKIIEGDEAGPAVSGSIRLAPERGPDVVQRTTSESDPNPEQADRAEVQEPPQEVDPKNIQLSVEPDVESQTAELNAQIREENQPKFERVKKEFKRLLSPGGLLPKEVFDAKIKRDSELGAVEIDIRQILRQFDDAVKDAYGRNLDEVEQQQVHDALTKDFANIDNLGLDTDVKNAVVMMRKYLDNMSVDYAQVLFKEAQDLAAQGKDEAVAAKIDLIQTIVGNAGQYLHRSYRAFDDPNWAKNVPDEVLDAARTYLTESGTTNVENVLNQILKEGTAFDSMEGFIKESKLGAKDLSILKRRKDIAPEIRALLGEYIDPKINFTKSATKMSRLLFNDRFLKQVKADGMGVFLFDDETAPPEAYQKFASDQSDVMAPLNGLRATPEIVQAFQDALGKEQMADWYRSIVQINGMVKYGKTVIAPTTIARNFLSAYMFTLANGHFNLAKSAESIANIQSYFKTKGDKVRYMRRLRELGVVYDTPYAGEMIALLDESNYDVMFGGKLKGLKGLFDNATKFYQFGDDFWKIVGFENEIDILMDRKGLTREQAEPLAADRIRNTYPTYSMVGTGIQKLRRFPLVGTFVSFPAEMIRTTFNMLKYMRQDMNDPDMSSVVPRRIAGLSMVSAGIYALQEALKDMVDVDEDEEEAVRLLGPDWSRNSNLAFIGREEGKLQYIDLSAFDPYNYFKRPLNALLRDQPIDDAVYQSAQELLTPFFGQDIAFQNIVEIWQNEKGSGGSVYNEQDSSSEQLEAIAGHIVKGIFPSVIQNISRGFKAMEGQRNAAGRVYKLEDEMAALTGLRVTTLDPKVSLHFKAYDFNQAKRDATSILTRTFRDINDVSDSELKDSFVRASTARREAFERMAKIVEAARKAGLSKTDIVLILRSNGVSKKDALSLEQGVTGSWSLSDTTLKNSVEKADLLFGEATGQEYERRWSLVQRLMADE